MKQLVLFIIIVLVLDFIDSGFSSKCATLYNYQSFYGNPYSLTDGTQELRRLNFVPNSVKVSPGCSLTIFDVYGTKLKVEKDNANLGWNRYQVLDASCCQCEACSGAVKQLENLCARLFEHPNCDRCSGYRLEMKDGNQAKNFGPLNKKITSVAIKEGCTLTVFTEPNFDGYRHNLTSSSDTLGDNWYKQISSAKCGCDPNAIYPTIQPTQLIITRPTLKPWPPWTAPTTKPAWTLPTVPTTRPAWTLPTEATTRPPMTLPTVPTTRPVWTLPTEATTRPPMTLPTVPTTRPTETTRPPMTLPTVPTTTTTTTTTTKAPITLTPSEEEESEENDDWSKEDDDFYGGEKSDEISPIKTTTTEAATEEEEDDWGW